MYKNLLISTDFIGYGYPIALSLKHRIEKQLSKTKVGSHRLKDIGKANL